jgi:peptide-methionine (S)-S-oxide reductase
MRYAIPGILGVLLLLLVISFTAKYSGAAKPAPTTSNTKAAEDPHMKKATFAAGCFWGVEETFRHVPGVVATRVGYIGGKTDNPTYKQVCTDLTGHAEAVEVTYDPSKVSYPELLDAFWTCHNPTTLNRQGPDIGTQYRSAIFTHDADQEKLARESLKEVTDSNVFKGKKIVTEIVPAGTFYSAEDDHQQYFAKNGGVCHAGIATVHTKLAQEAKTARENAPAVTATQP